MNNERKCKMCGSELDDMNRCSNTEYCNGEDSYCRELDPMGDVRTK